MADDNGMVNPEVPGDSSTLNLELCHQLGGIQHNLQNGFSAISNQIQALRSEVATARAPTHIKATQPQPPPRRGSSGRQMSEEELLASEKNALIMENEHMRREMEKMRNKLQHTEHELQVMRIQAEKLHGELQATRGQAEKLRGESERFRSIILGQAGAQKLSDQEVASGFVKLRQAVQKLARNPAYALDKTPILPAIHLRRPEMEEFYDQLHWGSLSSKDRGFRMRAKIFEMLHDDILSLHCFGLDGFEKDEANGLIGGKRGERDSLGTVEPGLQRFERLLKESQVDENTIDEWRIATIRCAEMCKFEQETSGSAAKEIFTFFEPLIPGHTSPVDRDALRSVIMDLSKDAFKLRMIMRKSKEGYVCDPVAIDHTTVQLVRTHDPWVEPQAVEGGDNSQNSDEIAYPLFGALVKRKDSRILVLEKAQVILKRKH